MQYAQAKGEENILISCQNSAIFGIIVQDTNCRKTELLAFGKRISPRSKLQIGEAKRTTI